MNTEGSIDIKWRFRRNDSKRRGHGSGIHSKRYSPPRSWATPPVHVESWLNASSRNALIRHGEYIKHRELHDSGIHRPQETTHELGDISKLTREIGGKGFHYRIVISPARGDLLDMKTLVENTVKNVQQIEGKTFKWAGAIHRVKEPNSVGVYNVHAHLIIEGGFGGSAMFSREFRDEARREAARQMDMKRIIGTYDRELAREITAEIRRTR